MDVCQVAESVGVERVCGSQHLFVDRQATVDIGLRRVQIPARPHRGAECAQAVPDVAVRGPEEFHLDRQRLFEERLCLLKVTHGPVGVGEVVQRKRD